MADYATSADLETRFGAEQLLIAADRDGDGTADTGVIAGAISEASDEIDSYLAVRYTLPLVATPDVLTMWCCEIAMYRMSADAGRLTEEKRRRYEDAVRWLRDLSAGKATLGVNETSETGDDQIEIGGGDSETSYNVRLFTRTKLGGVL